MTTPKVAALVDESLAQYIDALDGVGAGVVLYDREDRFVFCNRAYRQSFPERYHHLLARGVTFETLVRACIDDQYILAAIGNEVAYITERMRVHRHANDRSVRRFGNGSWQEIHEYRTRDGGTVLTRQDVTARKNAEVALAQSQRTLETLMSNLPGMAYRIRIEGDQAEEVERFTMEKRIREVEQGPSGAIWVLEDKKGGRLLRLSPHE